MSRALIFDCDGVLGDTEQFGHLPAFNQMWKECGVPWSWSVDEYGRKLEIGGGKERMASLFSEPAFLAAWPECPADDAARRDVIAAWHKKKTAIYKDIILSGRIPPRPGVKRLAEEAMADGWTLAVASTSAEEAVRAVLRHAVGEDTYAHFGLVLAGDCVKSQEARAGHLPARRREARHLARRVRGRRGFEQRSAGRHLSRHDVHRHRLRLHP